MPKGKNERGFAMMIGAVVLLIVVVLSTSLVYSSVTHHVQSIQAADRAKSLALAEGGAALLLAELNDDPLGPVKATTTYTVVGNAYTRRYEPFDKGDGFVKVEIFYHNDDGTALLFADRADPKGTYGSVRLLVTGVRPRADRAVEIVLEQRFTLLEGGAIVNDSIAPTATGSNKSLGHEGHIVFNDKGRPNQLYVSGNIMSNAGIYFEDATGAVTTASANNFITFAGVITADLAGTEQQVLDYTAPGSTDQLFDFGRFIAAAEAGAGREFEDLEDFAEAMNAANAAGVPLEGITVLTLDPKDYANKNPHIQLGPPAAGKENEQFQIVGGINIRGTLLFNFEAGTHPLYKVFIKVPLNVNPADLTNLVVSDASTYTSGYTIPWTNNSLKPSAVDITGKGFLNFTAEDDIPAMMFNTGVVDVHGQANISGLVYGPSFIEIENKEGLLQYFNGSVLGGGGIYFEGNSTSGYTVVNFDSSTINKLATKDGKGEGLQILSWRTLR